MTLGCHWCALHVCLALEWSNKFFFLSAKMQTWVNKASCLGFRVYFPLKKTHKKPNQQQQLTKKNQQHTKQWVTQTYVHTLKKLKKIRMLSKHKKLNNCLSN